ncbi:MAG: hypothetical protein JW783_15715 [Bacteroidales bacterium]|nr:hypothetical protein [Bacteroidales bacterium]MBN2748006.1 hypothetical protein [Bacteroidales bacterium]
MIKKLLIILCIMINLSCSAQKSDSIEIKYFQSWGGYKIPKKPQIEIKSDSLDKYSAYYKAYYSNKLIVKFEEYVNGELNGYDEYIYWDNSKKLKCHILVNEDGEKRIHHYDKRGKLIKE